MLLGVRPGATYIGPPTGQPRRTLQQSDRFRLGPNQDHRQGSNRRTLQQLDRLRLVSPDSAARWHMPSSPTSSQPLSTTTRSAAMPAKPARSVPDTRRHALTSRCCSAGKLRACIRFFFQAMKVGS